MDTARSIINHPPPPVSVADEAWSFCLSSRLLASFLDKPSEFCKLSASCRAFLPFRLQIWRIVHDSWGSHSTLMAVISSGRLPYLCSLELTLHCDPYRIVEIPFFAPIIAGRLPSLKNMRLYVFEFDKVYAVPLVIRLMALPQLERLEVKGIEGYQPKAIEAIAEAALRYPHLKVLWKGYIRLGHQSK